MTSLVVGATAVVSSVPLLALGAVLVIVVVTPIARSLARRIQLWMIGGLAGSGLLSALPGASISAPTAIGCAALGITTAWAVKRGAQGCSWKPRISAPDWLVMAAAMSVFAILIVPYRGAGDDGVMLDMARSFDFRSHYVMVHNLILENSTSWPTADGSPPESTEYPLGLHVLGALSLFLAGSGQPDQVVGFALVTAFGAAMSALLLGFIATDIALRAGPVSGCRRRPVVAASIALVAFPLGGLISGLFEVGHTAFLVPATIAGTASWLALINKEHPRAAALVLSIAAAGLAWSYPPLLGGVAPAMVLVAWAPLRGWVSRRVVLVGIGVVAMVGLQVWNWRSSLEVVAIAVGEFSTPTGTSFLMLLLMLILLGLAHQRGWHSAAVHASGAPFGFLLSCLAFVALAAGNGFPPLSNYYVAKLLQAAWIGCLPIIIGLSASFVVASAKRVHVPTLFWLPVGAACVGLGLAAVPDGRYAGLGGWQTVQQRNIERDRAGGQVNVVTTARRLGPGHGDVAIMVDPPGWFHRVSREGPADTQWVRAPSAASDWLNSLRGVKSSRQAAAALCMDTADPPACLGRWLVANSTASLTLVVPEGVIDPGFSALAGKFPTRVDLIVDT